MLKSLNEIATEIDEAQDSLELFAKSLYGQKGRFEICGPAGDPIDLRALADELRKHAGRHNNN